MSYLRIGDNVYCNASKINLPKLAEFEKSLDITIKHDSQDYLIEFAWISVIDSNEWFKLLKFLNRKLVTNLGFEKMLTRNRVFDPSEKIDFSAMGFAMWPGYFTNVIHRDCGMMMNVKSLHQIIRLENVLEKLLIIRELSVDQGLDYQEEIRKVFVGEKVVTKYNDKTYVIEDIDFEINTESVFQIVHNEEAF